MLVCSFIEYVLIFTGVGKTEVAFRIGQALFSSNEEHPPGFLLIKGSDYASIDHFSELSGSGARSQSYRDHILKLQNKFRDEIYAHVRKCSNFAVIAIDEVQKFEPGVLEVRDTMMMMFISILFHHNR